MRHPSLRSFLETLRREGELHLIEELIDPYLELAEIHRRTVSRQGPALLFTRVARTDFPVVTNLFGTRRRIDLAFGEEPSRFFRRIVEAAATLMPPSLPKVWSLRDLAGTALRVGTKSCSSGPVVEKVMKPPRLKSLP
jgi:UbiD family decarboxylase